MKESEELLFAKPVIPLNTLPAPHGVQLKISGSNLSAGCDYVSVVADNVYGEPMNFDMGNDALKMMSFDPRIPQIYVYNEKGVRFAHTQTADIEGETTVGIYTGESGIYEISLTEDSEYDRYDVVVLIDRSTGRKVDLKHAESSGRNSSFSTHRFPCRNSWVLRTHYRQQPINSRNPPINYSPKFSTVHREEPATYSTG